MQIRFESDKGSIRSIHNLDRSTIRNRYALGFQTMTTLPNDVQVTMLLCDHAAVADGKLYLSGGGWTHIPASPVPFAIALLVQVPWSMGGQVVPFRLHLVSADGLPVMISDAAGQRPLQVEGQINVAHSSHQLPGSLLPVPLAFNFPGLPLPSGQRLVWQLEINGRASEKWSLPFDVQ